MQRDISRTFPDGKTENFVEQVIENSDKSVQIKRTYENGTIENIKTERPSETTKIETISIKKPDGTKKDMTIKTTKNPDGTRTVKKTFDDGHVETETIK